MGGYERVTVHQAAREIGVNAQCLRIHMQKGLWNLGIAIPPTQGGNKRWMFIIYRNKLDKFLQEVAAT